MKNLGSRLNPGLLGITPYEPGKTVSEAVTEGRGPSADFIKLASNENPLGMSPAALAALGRRAAEGFAYPEVSGREARLALAQRLRISPDNIILGNGGDGIIYACAMAMLDQDDEAVIPDLTFPYYEIAVRAMRGTIVRSPMKHLAIDLDDVLSRITPRTKMIWIANPNNPTGALIDKKAFDDFYRRVPEDVFCIHDEVYADFAETAAFPDTLNLIREGRDNLFLIRSFSKIYGLAGVRVGYGVGAVKLVKMMYRVRPPFDVSVLAQIAAAAAVGDETFYTRSIELNTREKGFLATELKQRGLKPLPTATNFILINVGRDGRELCERLLERGVIVRAPSHPLIRDCIRVTIGTHEQNQVFLAALDEVLAS